LLFDVKPNDPWIFGAVAIARRIGTRRRRSLKRLIEQLSPDDLLLLEDQFRAE